VSGYFDSCLVEGFMLRFKFHLIHMYGH